MIIRVDPLAVVPPYEQIRAQLEAQIRSGDLVGASRLPSIRQLAADLGVAPGTVQSAYRELEAAGLIVSSRSQGTVVATGKVEQEVVLAAAIDLARTAREAALDLERTLAILRACWERA